MSNTVDERIVEMQFNNGEFEKGIQESLKSLEALKKGLELDKSSKSLDNLSKIVSNVDFSGMAKGIETISNRFTTMGIIGMRALQNITDKVMAMSEHWVKSVTVDQISAGFNKYAQKTEAVQTIMSATGKTVKEVEEVLGKLNEYTDWTSFNFAEMTTTIGKFTSSGVDLEVAEKAMEGIGNEASLAGATIQNANHAMYNFAQALATGKVQLMDWKSIENANMATKQFKETIIDTAVELGTLKRGQDGVSKTTKGTIVDYAKFNATLSEGWFTSDVLIKTLEKYADTTTELGQKAFDAAKKAITFGQAIDSIKDAVSTGWMNTFQLIFGNFEEASELWTGFADGAIDALSQFSEARNSLLNGWRDLNGEDGRKILLDGLVEIFQVLGDILTMVKYVVKEFFPPITASHLMAISKGVKEFADGLYEAVHATEMLVGGGNSLFSAGGPELNLKGNVIEKIEELQGVLKKGDKNDEVKQLQLRLMELGYSLDEHGADGIFGPETQKALKDFQTKAGITVDGIYGKQSHEAMGKALAKDIETAEGPLENVENYVYNLTEGLTTLQRIARGFFAVVHIGAKAGAFVVNVIKSALTLLKPLGNVLLTVGAVIGDCLVSLDKWLTESGIYEQALGAVQNALAPIGDWISKISKSITDFLTTGPKIESFADLWDRFKTVLLETDFGKSLAGAFERIKKTKFFEGMSKFLSNIQVKFKTFVNWVKFLFNWTKSGAKPMGKYTGIIDKFRQGIEKVKEVFSNFPTKVVEFGESIYRFVSKLVESAKQSPVIRTFVENIGKLFEGMGSGLSRFVSKVPSFMTKIKSLFTSLFPSGKDSGFETSSILDRIKGMFSNVVDVLKDPSKWGDVFSKVKPSIKKFANGIKEFYDLLVDTVKRFIAAGSIKEKLASFSDLLSWIKEKWSGIVEKVKEMISGGQVSASISNLIGESNFAAVSEYFSKVVKFVSDIYSRIKSEAPFFYKLIKGVFILGILGGIRKLIKRITGGVDGISGGLVNMFGSITSMFKGVAGLIADLPGILKGFRKDVQPLALSVIEIAGAVALISASIWLLSKLSPDELLKGGLVVLAIAGAITAFAFLASKAGGSNFGNVGKSLLGIAGTFAILVGLAYLLGKLGPDGMSTLATGFKRLANIAVAMFLFMVAIQVLNRLTNQNGFQASGLLGISVAIGVLSFIAMSLAKVDGEALKTGLLRLTNVMVIMAGFALIMALASRLSKGGIKLKGFIAMSLAIGVLSGIAYLLGKQSKSVMRSGLKNLAIVSAILGGLMIIMAVIGHFSKGGGIAKALVILVAVVAAISALSFLVIVLGKLDPAEAQQGLTALAIISACLTVLSGVVAVLGALPLLSVLKGSVALVAVGAALAAVVAIFAAVATTALDNIASSMFTLGSALQDYSNMISDIVWEKMESSLTFLENFAKTTGALIGSGAGTNDFSDLTTNLYRMGYALKSYGKNVGDLNEDKLRLGRQVGSDMAFIGNRIKELEDVDAIATAIGTIGGAIKLYYDSMAGVNPANGSMAIENMSKIFGDLAAAVPTDADIEKIEGFAGDGKSGEMTLFAIGIENLGTALQTYGDIADHAPLPKIREANNILMSFARLQGVLELLTAGDGVLTVLTGKRSSLSAFALDIEALGGALGSFADSIGGNENYDADEIREAKTILNDFVSMQGNLEKAGGLAEVFQGKKSLSDFGSKLSALGKGFANYASAVSRVTDWDNVKESTAPIEALANAQSTLQSSGGLWGFIAGAPDLTGFATALPKLGEAIAGYVDALGGRTFDDNVSGSTGVIQSLANIQSSLPDTGGWAEFLTGSQNLGDLGEGLKNFATKLNEADQALAKYNGEKITQAVGLLKDVAKAALSIYQNSFAFTLGELANQINDFYTNIQQDLDTDAGIEVVEAMTNLILNLPTDMQTSIDQISSVGQSILDVIATGVTNADASGLMTAIGTAVSSSQKIGSGYTSGFHTIGKQIVQGLANGITLNTFIAVSAAQRLMGRVKQAAADTVEIQSPSKVFAEMGMFIDKGLANGLIQYSGVAEKAASGVMDSTLSSTQNLLSNLSELVANGIDPNPTITPVLDLSNITAGSGQIGGILSGFGIGANLNFRGPANVSLAEKYGNTDVVDAINNLNGRMNEMATAISNMQVVMETGALVGQISTSMDQSLGRIAATKGRMG